MERNYFTPTVDYESKMLYLNTNINVSTERLQWRSMIRKMQGSKLHKLLYVRVVKAGIQKTLRVFSC